MAEAAISFVLESLTEVLDQIQLPKGVHGRVERLRDELKRMQCFLKDADTKQGADMRVRNWVSDIRNVAYDAEDLIDTYLLKNSDISVSRQTYGIKNVGEGTNHANEKLLKLRRSSPRGQYKDIIGLEKDVATLVTQLVKEEDRWHAISIVGMGGIGKTTLAKEVYNQVSVQSRFDCRAWIYVSQDFRTRDVLQDIIKQASKTRRNLRGLGEEALEEMLYEHLESKRYSVVLDDIWSTMAWDSLAKAFPNGGNGSRLLLTTCNTNVALHADPESSPHEMSFRSKDDSWKLLCKKTFIESIDRLCPPQLEEIGGEIVTKCAGLPLAIIVLGGLLSRKKRLSEWQRFCFLYLGLFPEDHLISTRKLYRLWIAEGFIPQHGERMEEIAEDYLNELIDRNMVQVARMSANDRVKHCRLHDLLLDLSISKSRLEQFFVFQGNLDSLSLAKARHHVVYTSSVQSLDDILELEYLELLEELDIEESTALSKLKSFHISSCFRLTNISEGMKFVMTLQELEIKQMRKRFTGRLQGED
ncbi:NB-ARC domain containing protein [Trema orientale]|uniref:NB-ARC domain containing protein n=1 Tax=Trema orientale TaxID=63057 RepID=A0A2P5F3P2_TREOI|nr:NB-ARC domain containing protein [Trema orientale]